MSKTCFVCSIRPILYFNSLSGAFAKLRCPHSDKNVARASITQSTPRRCFGFLLCAVLAILSSYELYVDFSLKKLSLFSLLATTELTSMCMGLFRNFANNLFHAEKLRELQVMLSVAEYVNKFNIVNHDYEKIRKWALVGVASSVLTNALPMYYFLYDGVNTAALMMSLNRFFLGMFLTPRYFQTIFEFSYYRLFFKWTFAQIEREVRARLREPKELKIIFGNEIYLQRASDGSFLRHMKKLRKLYMIILNSFRRTKRMTNAAMVMVILGYYILLSLMLCIVVMGVRGDIELHAGHYLYLTKHCTYVTHLVAFSYICDGIQELVQEMFSVLFKIPLNALDKDEAREIEILVNLLSWEHPIDRSNDMMDYGNRLLAMIIVDVVTNCMVVIQLYFWFKQYYS